MTQSALKDQVILITGASAGIGAALARELAGRYPGVRLVLAARRQERLAAIAQSCREAGATVLVVPVDITQANQVQMLAAHALAEFGRVDALVNNAGYGQMGPVELVPIDAAQHQFAVNLLGPLSLIQALIPTMRAQGGGRIVNISSLGGRLAFPFGGLYSASKFALEGLSDALRMELEPFNIRVSVIEPGPVATNFFDVAKAEIDEAIVRPQDTSYGAAFERFDAIEQQMNRQIWTPERVAGVIIRALGDRRPKPRYVAATGGRIFIFLMTKVLPTWLVDRFWQRFYGIDRVAQNWRRQRASQD
jgi:NAD(P)-dependent dehydrogenase (short-subunit alcohol dehydrogenase family)